MQPDFWLERWQRGETGFHQAAANRWLTHRIDALQLKPGDHVFVPLCGKSQDLHFLAGRGYRVTGVELSPVAVEAFFEEHGMTALVRSTVGMRVYESGLLRIFCGDFFRMTTGLLGHVDAVFDRAALIALPPEMRPAYAAHLGVLLPAGARDLLVSFDYEQSEMAGPPFSVPQAEIRALFGDRFDIAALGREDILAGEPRFRERGLTRLAETCWLLQKRA